MNLATSKAQPREDDLVDHWEWMMALLKVAPRVQKRADPMARMMVALKDQKMDLNLV